MCDFAKDGVVLQKGQQFTVLKVESGFVKGECLIVVESGVRATCMSVLVLLRSAHTHTHAHARTRIHCYSLHLGCITTHTHTHTTHLHTQEKSSSEQRVAAVVAALTLQIGYTCAFLKVSERHTLSLSHSHSLALTFGDAVCGVCVCRVCGSS